jgi:hypothetical protein
MLNQLRERAVDDPAIGLLVALARAEQGVDAGAFATLRAAIQRFRPDGLPPEFLFWRLAAWIAEDVKPYSFDHAYRGAFKGGPEPEIHADATIEALESRSTALAVHPAIFSLAAWRVAGIGSRLCGEQRKAGRLDDARLTSACLSAFARKLMHRNPADACFHLIRSEAFEQEVKNAWKVDDFPAIDEGLRKALSEACIALRLDPRNETARIWVSGIQDKLVKLASERPPSR